jgi:hypothetical protein
VAGNDDIAARQRRCAAINAGKAAPLLLWRHLLALRVWLVTGNTRVVPSPAETSPPARCGRRRPSLFLCLTHGVTGPPVCLSVRARVHSLGWLQHFQPVFREKDLRKGFLYFCEML